VSLAAVIQLSSTSDAEANWQQARELVTRAADRGARLVATPENTNFLGPHPEKVATAESLDGQTCTRFAELAQGLEVQILLGSFNERSDEAHRCYNTSVLFDRDGSQLAVYRKIHLFDVDVSPAVRFAESATVKAGSELVTVDSACGTMGMSVCYDLRFPGLYQQLRDRGAEILTIPSAFTLTTGKDHWHSLLRARAIETQCYVLAPAQFGKHDDEGLRESYGHAMVVDPWGQIVAMVADGPGVALAEIDRDRLAEIRASMPVVDHRRF
jgi:predicted amidohydrolase